MVISISKHTDFRRLINNYEAVYAKLCQVLDIHESAIFSKVSLSSTADCKWFGEDGFTYIPYGNLSDDDKDVVSILLDDAKQQIEIKLSSVAELKDYASKLFVVPSENQIFAYRDNQNLLQVILTQWACESTSRDEVLNPVSVVVNRPKKDFTLVKLQLNYSDGSIYQNSKFLYLYRDVEKEFVTNQNGERVIGYQKNGAVFSVKDTQLTNPTQLDFTVTEGQEIYQGILPKYCKVTLRIINQNEEVKPKATISVNYKNQTDEYTSNEQGEIKLNNVLKTSEPFVVGLIENSITHEFELKEQENLFVIKIQAATKRTPIFEIINEDEEKEINYPVIIYDGATTDTFYSNNDGFITTNEVETDKEFTLTDGKNKYYNEKFLITADSFEHTFKIQKTKPEFVTVTLIDHKNKPLPSIPLDLSLIKQEHNQITNEQGKIIIPKELFTDKEKVNVKVDINAKKPKLKNFVYDESKNDYTIKLKKFNYWWLLLLLLLLLVIPLKKDVVVQALTNTTVVPNTDVSFRYVESHIFKDGSFFYSKKHEITQKTGLDGKTTFKELGYSVYSYIFKYFEEAQIMGIDKCMISDTLRPRFHGIGNNEVLILPLKSTNVSLDFKVVDKEDNEPINKALIVYKSIVNGVVHVDSGYTNSNGIFIAQNLPKCGMVELIYASHFGYAADSIISTKIENLAGNLDPKRKLSLRPIKKKIEFYVTNCQTGQPLPDGVATITIIGKDGAFEQEAITNVNGKGKGFYDDIHIASTINIRVSKKYFKDGLLKKDYIVDEFIKLPDSTRTVCLQPEEHSVDFQNVDSLSRQGLAGVSNVVMIENNGKKRSDTLLSNKNGFFTVGNITLGDKVSIAATLNPIYETNDYTIKNLDGIKLLEATPNDRIIPLSPKTITLSFFTKDAVTNLILPDVSLAIYVNNQPLQNPTNSGSGTFQVKLKYGSIISIVANKVSYVENSTTIQNKDVTLLANSSNEERTIPLGYPPCETSEEAKQNESVQKQYDMGKVGGEFVFDYKTFGVADEIIVYDGPSTSSPQIFYFFDKTSEQETRQETLKFSNRIITVVVNVKLPGQTQWYYKVNCPD